MSSLKSLRWICNRILMSSNIMLRKHCTPASLERIIWTQECMLAANLSTFAFHNKTSSLRKVQSNGTNTPEGDAFDPSHTIFDDRPSHHQPILSDIVNGAVQADLDIGSQQLLYPGFQQIPRCINFIQLTLSVLSSSCLSVSFSCVAM